MRKALIYTVDENDFALALFSAERIARLSGERDFDIIIGGFDPMPIPDDIAALGVTNEVFDLRDVMEAENLPLKWLPIMTYMRLWLPGLLADRYDRFFYMDADTYPLTGELSRLFEIDFGEHALAAALDKEQWWHLGKPIFDFQTHDIPSDRYFNAGLCMFDVRRYNERGLLEEMLEMNRAGIERRFHDQSLLNLVTKGRFAEISPRWNWQWTNRFPHFTRRADPLILHLSGFPKPWEAHEKPTNFPQEIIAEFSDFLTRHGAKRAFRVDRPGGLRPGGAARAKTMVEHARLYPNFRRLMRRHSDAFETRL